MSKRITLIEDLANHFVKEMNGTAQYLNVLVGLRKTKLTSEDLDAFDKIAKRLGEHAAFLKEIVDDAPDAPTVAAIDEADLEKIETEPGQIQELPRLARESELLESLAFLRDVFVAAQPYLYGSQYEGVMKAIAMIDKKVAEFDAPEPGSIEKLLPSGREHELTESLKMALSEFVTLQPYLAGKFNENVGKVISSIKATLAGEKV